MDEVHGSLPSCDSNSSSGDGGKSAKREEEEKGRDAIASFQQTFTSSSANLSLLGGAHSYLSSREEPYFLGKAVTSPRLEEDILIGETDSNSLIL